MAIAERFPRALYARLFHSFLPAMIGHFSPFSRRGFRIDSPRISILQSVAYRSVSSYGFSPGLRLLFGTERRDISPVRSKCERRNLPHFTDSPKQLRSDALRLRGAPQLSQESSPTQRTLPPYESRLCSAVRPSPPIEALLDQLGGPSSAAELDESVYVLCTRNLSGLFSLA